MMATIAPAGRTYEFTAPLSWGGLVQCLIGEEAGAIT